MAELTPKERLLPSLLDRLTDHMPGTKEELRNRRALSMKQFRKSVLRDLEWLMNTVNLESAVNFEEFPELRNSVINYGMPCLSGSTVNNADRHQITKLIRQSIQAFEPRILKDTVKVTLLEDEELENRAAIAFQIEGTLWGNPLPEALFLRTELDLDLGEVKITDSW
ncbi:MAG: type VI secretion system baseplate subunit TssE [Granulosicoccus sp.]